jgi:hypothetical protein
LSDSIYPRKFFVLMYQNHLYSQTNLSCYRPWMSLDGISSRWEMCFMMGHTRPVISVLRDTHPPTLLYVTFAVVTLTKVIHPSFSCCLHQHERQRPPARSTIFCLLFMFPSLFTLSLPCMNERLHPHACPFFRRSRDLRSWHFVSSGW